MRRTVLLATLALILSLPLVASAQPRPRLMVADPTVGCPGVAGRYVVVLDPSRGMLLLSAAAFPAAGEVGTAAGGAMTAQLPGRRPWPLAEVVSSSGEVTVWGSSYPLLEGPLAGCVAFDKERFSSEGDLVTYVRWLTEKVYGRLPEAERERTPAFTLSDREVRLRLQVEGFKPLVLAGKEGATRSFRLPGNDATYLLVPFVLDANAGRVAVQVGFTNERFWEGGEKRDLDLLIVSRDEPGRLRELPLTIHLEAIEPSSQ